jgi:hypothetical protein
MTKPTFLRFSNRTGFEQIHLEQNGCGKSITVASKLEIPISQLVVEIETKFQQLNLHFRGPAIK